MVERTVFIPESFGKDGFFVQEDLLPEADRLDMIHELEQLRSGIQAHSLRNVHVSPKVSRLASSSMAYEVAHAVLGPAARLVRAIFFDKVPGANWSVPWHQDLTIAVAEKVEFEGYGPWSQKDGVTHVQPPAEILENMVTVRIHLDSCGVENGPVRVKPGSHLHGRISETMVSKWEGEEVACVGKAGSALVMRPLILHASSPSSNPAHRRVLHLEYAGVELPSPLRWYLDSNMGNQ